MGGVFPLDRSLLMGDPFLKRRLDPFLSFLSSELKPLLSRG